MEMPCYRGTLRDMGKMHAARQPSMKARNGELEEMDRTQAITLIEAGGQGQ